MSQHEHETLRTHTHVEHEWTIRLPAPARVPAQATEDELNAHYDLLDALQKVKERVAAEKAQEHARVRARGTDVGRRRKR